MSASEETSALFPLFILSVLVIPLAPYTLYCTWNFLTDNAKAIHCQCALCFKRKFKRISSSSTSKKIIILLLWATVAALIYYIKHTVPDPQLFEPYNILGLEVGASESEIKKAYRKLSILHHPDKNPDPEANVYFIEFISKAYQTLTDPRARENYEKYGHPDGRQGFKVGIALPYFIMQVDGPAAGYVLLGLFGIFIILPMIITLFYLLKSSKYTSNFIMHKTMSAYFHSVTPSLSPSNLIDIFIEAEEFDKIPILKSDDESLRQLFTLLKSELSSNETNTKVEQRKFWKQGLHRIKKLLLIHAHLTCQLNSLSSLQHRDLELILKIAPNLLEELMKIALLPRSPLGHGFLKSAATVVKFHQHIIQAVPLSARKTNAREPEGIAPFLQLPHFNGAIVKKLREERQSLTFQELREMSMSERSKLLSNIAGFSSSEIHDIETVLKTMPTITLDISIYTENEKGIEENDIATMHAWVNIKRENSLIAALSHAPHFPFYKEENFWLVLADPDSNEVWLSQKLSFMDEYKIISSTRKLTRSLKEGSGASCEEVEEEVRLAVEKARNGSQLVVGRFSAPRKGTYKLVAYCFCDAWIGCDAKAEKYIEILKGVCRCADCLRVAQGVEVVAEEDEVDEDYESEYSDDDDEDGKQKKN